VRKPKHQVQAQDPWLNWPGCLHVANDYLHNRLTGEKNEF